MPSDSQVYHPSHKEPHDLESRESSDIFEDNGLLGDRGGFPKMKKKANWFSGSACALICSTIMLLASIVIWSRVALQLKKFSCDVREEDNFEPDCKYPLYGFSEDASLRVNSEILQSCHLPTSSLLWWTSNK
jgi:hypothetical protein